MAEFYFRAPRWAHLPHFHTILDSIGNDRAVAKNLVLLSQLSANIGRKVRLQGLSCTRFSGKHLGVVQLLM